MGFFSSILEKFGIGSAEAAEPAKTPSTPASPAPAPVSGAPAPAAETTAPAVQAVAVVDVVAKLEELAAANPQKLNWKTSIVDLLKLLGIDSSLEARKELARELDAPADKFGDSAALNIWLHKAVLQKLADNGGNVPAELLD